MVSLNSILNESADQNIDRIKAAYKFFIQHLGLPAERIKLKFGSLSVDPDSGLPTQASVFVSKDKPHKYVITVNSASTVGVSDLIRHLAHEFQHIVQTESGRFDVYTHTWDGTTYEVNKGTQEYYNLPWERDARKAAFELELAFTRYMRDKGASKSYKKLNENPDTIVYKGQYYVYSTTHNKASFMIYKDSKTNKDTMFGFSVNSKDFFSSDPDVIKEIKELENGLDFYKKQKVEEFRNATNGKGHYALEKLLMELNRYDNSGLTRGRIFELPDAVTVCTFWEPTRTVLKYLKFYEEAIKASGYDPTKILYESYDNSKGFMSYEEFITKGTAPSAITLKNGEKAKVGDKVVIVYASPDPNDLANPEAEIIKIGDDNRATLKITYSESKYFEVGSEMDEPGYYLLPFNQKARYPNRAESLESVIDEKTKEFVDKRAKLHTTGASLTTAEKETLEVEVDKLEIEIKLLRDILDSGEKFYTDNVKDVVNKSVERKLHSKKKEKQDQYSLIQQAEKQFGMPIAQIRQKYRGVPLDQLIKKESLYRKIMNQIL